MPHMFADVRQFRRDPLNFILSRGNDEANGLERLYLGPSPVLLVTDADLLRPILKTSESQIGKGRLIKKLTPVFGNSSLMLHGDEHKRRRAVLQQHMARSIVDRYIPQMCAEIRAVGAKFAHVKQFDPRAMMAALALRTICISVFGKQVISGGDEETLVQAVNMIEDDLADDMFRALPVGPIGALRRRVIETKRYAAAISSAMS